MLRYARSRRQEEERTGGGKEHLTHCGLRALS